MYLFFLLLNYIESFSTYSRGSNELLYVVFLGESARPYPTVFKSLAYALEIFNVHKTI